MIFDFKINCLVANQFYWHTQPENQDVGWFFKLPASWNKEKVKRAVKAILNHYLDNDSVKKSVAFVPYLKSLNENILSKSLTFVDENVDIGTLSSKEYMPQTRLLAVKSVLSCSCDFKYERSAEVQALYDKANKELQETRQSFVDERINQYDTNNLSQYELEDVILSLVDKFNRSDEGERCFKLFKEADWAEQKEKQRQERENSVKTEYWIIRLVTNNFEWHYANQVHGCSFTAIEKLIEK